MAVQSFKIDISKRRLQLNSNHIIIRVCGLLQLSGIFWEQTLMIANKENRLAG